MKNDTIHISKEHTVTLLKNSSFFSSLITEYRTPNKPNKVSPIATIPINPKTKIYQLILLNFIY